MVSARIPSLKSKDIVKILEKLGFKKIRQSGSHMFFAHTDGKTTLIPNHGRKDIGRGLLRHILKDIDISPREFMKLL